MKINFHCVEKNCTMSLADYLSSPLCIKYRGLWDNADNQKDGLAIAALS